MFFRFCVVELLSVAREAMQFLLFLALMRRFIFSLILFLAIFKIKLEQLLIESLVKKNKVVGDM